MSPQRAFLLGAAASLGLILGSVALLVAIHLHDGEDPSDD